MARSQPDVRGHGSAPVPWYALDGDEVLRRLDATRDGLSGEEVARRRATYGRNELPTAAPPTLLQTVLHQVASPFVAVLAVAGVISLVLGDTADAAFIAGVVVLNTIVGTVQERRAEQSAAALRQMMTVVARARRDGHVVELPATDLVPGDVILLESGDRVPADARLLRATRLEIDESLLTGESEAVAKAPAPVPADAVMADRTSVAHAGSSVASGRGLAAVVATGRTTQVGRIAVSVSEGEGGRPPLVQRMDRFSRQVSVAVLALCALLAVVAFLQGTPLAEVFMLAVALAVAAIPEALPVVLTVVLAIATQRMLRRRVIVRRLTAVEGLGSCTLIATDKTGTLTLNEQTVRAVHLADGTAWGVTGGGYAGEGEVRNEVDAAPQGASAGGLRRLAEAVVAANEASLVRVDGAWHHRGDPVDVALLALAYKLGVDPEAWRDAREVVAEIPFEAAIAYAASAVRDGEDVRIAVKGAAETVLPLCDRTLAGDPVDARAAAREVRRLAARGYRVLAVADARLPAEDVGDDPFRRPGDDAVAPPPLTLLGWVGLIDPLRPSAAPAIAEARAAGVDVVMVTGDHPATAVAIAEELGLTADQGDGAVVTGAELPDGDDPAAWRAAVAGKRVFARVTPTQKLHVVRALAASGHFVAVTGDGVNDAPALREAHLGVAMGSGTDVAKGTADMIVVDDDIASIVAGIEEGRGAYDNVRKVVAMQVSTGAAEVGIFLLALVAGLPLPLVAVQVLWLNVVTNGLQDVGLALEGTEPGVMRRPPRPPSQGLFDRWMIVQVVLAGSVMAGLSVAAFAWVLARGGDVVAARTAGLLLMVLLQNLHVLNCRSETRSLFRMPITANPWVYVVVIAAQLLHLGAMAWPPARELLRIGTVDLTGWLVLAAMAASLTAVMEVAKAVERRRRAAATSPAAGPRAPAAG